MKVVTHPSPIALEQWLLQAVADCKKNDPLAPVLVIVPTSRLAATLRRRLITALGAYLAVDVLPHRAISMRAATHGAGRTPRVASPVVLATLLDRMLVRRQDSPWARFARRRPGARSALLAALTDLREAGLDAHEVEATLEDRDLAAIFSAWRTELDRVAEHGLLDEAGLVKRALPHVAATLPRGSHVYHHGAYELIGVHLDLVRAIDAASTVTFLLPCAPGAPATRYAEDYAHRYLLRDGAALDAATPVGECGGMAPRLSALWNENATEGAIDGPPVVHFRHAQGAGAEAEIAVKHALEAARTGMPAEEIAFIVRDTAAWATPFEEALGDRRIPYTSPARHPLRREPMVDDLLAALELVRDGFPRAATARWLASPRLDWRRFLGEGRPVRGGRADAWSRQAGILGGIDEWTDELTAWAQASVDRAGGSPRKGPKDRELQGALPFAAAAARAEAPAPGDWRRRRLDDVKRLGRALQTVRRALEPERRRRWSAHADTLESLRDRLLPDLRDAENSVAETFRSILDDMRALDAAVEPGREVPLDQVVAWVTDAVGQAGVRPCEADRGGFRVLDVRQARGMVFRHVLLMGLQSGHFPRTPREDPVLPDAERLRLRRASGRPLAVAGEADDEERLLFALALASARERIDLSWQRSDETGRALAPSLALREVARIVLGDPTLAAVSARATRVAGHPLRGLQDAVDDPGLLSPDDEIVLLALSARGPEEAAIALASRRPEFADGLAMLAAVESFETAMPSFDGRVDASARIPNLLSPTHMETLGRCPLRFFFKTVLKVREADADVLPWRVDPRDLGIATHRLLETLYRRLVSEGALDGGAEHAGQRARAILDEAWPEHAREVSRRQRARLPLLWELEQSRWRAAVSRFIDEDLLRLVTEGWRPVAFESERRRELDIGEGVVLPFRGRFDRVLARGDALRVDDYKTGSAYRFADKVAVPAILRGNELQAALYRELTGGEATVDLLRIGLGDREGSKDNDDTRRSFPGFVDADLEHSFHETLRILAGLLRERRFPMRPGDHCAHCPYRLACRRDHVPSREREAHAADADTFRLMKQKSSRRALLFIDDVRTRTEHPHDGREENP